MTPSCVVKSFKISYILLAYSILIFHIIIHILKQFLLLLNVVCSKPEIIYFSTITFLQWSRNCHYTHWSKIIRIWMSLSYDELNMTVKYYLTSEAYSRYRLIFCTYTHTHTGLYKFNNTVAFHGTELCERNTEMISEMMKLCTRNMIGTEYLNALSMLSTNKLLNPLQTSTKRSSSSQAWRTEWYIYFIGHICTSVKVIPLWAIMRLNAW